VKLKLIIGATVAAIGAILAALIGRSRDADRFREQRDELAVQRYERQLEEARQRRDRTIAQAAARRAREQEEIRDDLDEGLQQIDDDLGGAIDDALAGARGGRGAGTR
jgi:F0F1-type ATP synthase membrane subunit b/b'